MDEKPTALKLKTIYLTTGYSVDVLHYPDTTRKFNEPHYTLMFYGVFGGYIGLITLRQHDLTNLVNELALAQHKTVHGDPPSRLDQALAAALDAATEGPNHAD